MPLPEERGVNDTVKCSGDRTSLNHMVILAPVNGQYPAVHDDIGLTVGDKAANVRSSQHRTGT